MLHAAAAALQEGLSLHYIHIHVLILLPLLLLLLQVCARRMCC
jgi:hypothetical protein